MPATVTQKEIELTAYVMLNAARADRGLAPIEPHSIVNFHKSHWVRCVKSAIEAGTIEACKPKALIIKEKERRQCRSLK